MESLVIPHLDYCSVVYLDASSTLRTHLQRLSNSCVSFIFGIRRNTHITPYRRQLEWLRNDTRRDYFALLLMYIVRIKEPPILPSLFTPYQPDRPTRGPRKDLDIVKLPSDTLQVSYAKLWNSVPQNTRDVPSISQFKCEIRRYLLNHHA